MTDRRVVVTGIGVATPLGWELDELWSALIEKRSGIRRISAFDPGEFPSQVGGELPAFTLGEFIPKSYRKSAKVMSRDITISLIAAHRATTDAGLKTKCLVDRGEFDGPSNVDPTRFGANIGAGLICADVNELATALASAREDGGDFTLSKWGTEGMSNLTPLWLLKFLPNMLACHVTIVHDAQSLSNTVTCGEASSHLAIGEAYHTIRRGAADVCICGGVESKMNPMSALRQQLFHRLVTDSNAHPGQACRPFDAAGAGTVVSEGGGLLLLEDLEHARARGAQIYAEVVGFGASCNTHSWTEPDPAGASIAVAVGTALRRAALSPADVSLVGTFGTGIEAFDRSEATALKTVLGAHLPGIPAMAVKWAVGNNGAGSGAIDLAACLMAMKYNAVPPTPNTTRLLSDCDLNLIRQDAVDAPIDNFVSVAYALSGGQCAALVMRRFSD